MKIVVFVNRILFEKSAIHEDNYFHFKLLVNTFRNAWHLYYYQTALISSKWNVNIYQKMYRRIAYFFYNLSVVKMA